jgi:tetratricopeptide (TPR) repeat protein
MARERLPLIPRPRPLWVKALWAGVAALFALFLWIKTRPPEIPACDAAPVRDALAEAVKAINADAGAAQDIKPVAKDDESARCAAAVEKPGGEKVAIEYRVTTDGKTPKVEIMSGDDALAPPAAPEEASAAAGETASGDPAHGPECLATEDPEARISACGKIIEDGAANREQKATALVSRGDAYAETKDEGHALVDYAAALELLRKDGAQFVKAAQIRLKRGALFAAKGDRKQALAEYVLAVRTDASSADAYAARGCEYATQGTLAKAETDLTKAKSLGHVGPDAACQATLDALRKKPVKKR